MKGVFYIAFSFVTGYVLAQKPVVSLSVDYKSVQIGEALTFTVKSNVSGDVKIVFPDEFITGTGSMSGMEQEMDYNTGTVITIYYFSQNGAFKEEGNYPVFACVTNRKKTYKSNYVNIKVEKQNTCGDEEVSKKTLRQPVFGIVQRNKSKIYEGEPLIINAKVYSRLNINMLEGYKSFELEGGAEVHDLEKTQRLLLTREQFKGQSYSTFNYGKQLVFPSSTGKVKIDPFEMSLQYDNGGIFSERVTFTSLAASIEVLPLPSGAPKDFIGGVGSFDLESSLSKNTAKQGDVVILKIIVKGSGNIHNINKPLVNLPHGIIVYGDPEIKEEITYGIFGAEGQITYQYNLQVLNNGFFEIPAISLSYFDPDEKKYVRISKNKLKLNVQETKGFNASLPANAEKHPAAKVTPQLFFQEAEPNETALYESNWFWPSVVSPLFIAFAGGLFWTRKKDISSKILEKSSRKRNQHELRQKLAQIKASQGNTDPVTGISQLEQVVKSLGTLFKGAEAQTYSKAELLRLLREEQVSQNTLDLVNSILLRCEEARYSFEDKSQVLSETIRQVEDVLNELS